MLKRTAAALCVAASLATAPAQAGGPVLVQVHAFCLSIEGLTSVLPMLRAGDDGAYRALMSDPASDCADGRLMGMPPTIAVRGRKVGAEFDNAIGTCLAPYEVLNSSGDAAYSWLPCEGEGT